MSDLNILRSRASRRGKQWKECGGCRGARWPELQTKWSRAMSEPLFDLKVIVPAERIRGRRVKTFQRIRKGRFHITDVVYTER